MRLIIHTARILGRVESDESARVGTNQPICGMDFKATQLLAKNSGIKLVAGVRLE